MRALRSWLGSLGTLALAGMPASAGYHKGIFGQRYDSAGGARGDEFRVNSQTTSYQRSPSVASDASGNFIVVWESDQDGSGFGIFGQRYDSGGVAQGDEFRVNSFTRFNQELPSVASNVIGNFVVVWSGGGQDEVSGIFGQRYDSGGVEQGGEFRVNSYTTNNQRCPPLPPTRTVTSLSPGTAIPRTETATASSASATTARAWLRATSFA